MVPMERCSYTAATERWCVYVTRSIGNLRPNKRGTLHSRKNALTNALVCFWRWALGMKSTKDGGPTRCGVLKEHWFGEFIWWRKCCEMHQKCKTEKFWVSLRFNNEKIVWFSSSSWRDAPVVTKSTAEFGVFDLSLKMANFSCVLIRREDTLCQRM